MSDFVVDTQVLVCASHDDCGNHNRFLVAFQGDESLRLVIDSKGDIQREYGEKMRHDAFGMQWLVFMASHDRVDVRTCETRKKKKAEFIELRRILNAADRPFAHAAIASESNRLVAEEQHYSQGVRTHLRRHWSVSVLSAIEAWNEIGDADGCSGPEHATKSCEPSESPDVH
jgi:hypothetical protein